MLKLKRKNMDPPSGWVFPIENGFVIKAGHFDKLIREIIRHLEVNGHEIPDNLEDIVENYICTQNPQSICEGDGPKRHFPNSREIETVTKAIVQVARKGKDAFVSQEEAQKRAEVCAGCPKNINVWGCFLCTGLMKLITKSYGRKTTVDGYLRACAVCKCVNAAQVHLSKKVLANLPTDVDIKDYPEKDEYPCWKRELLEEEFNNGSKKDNNQEKISEEGSEKSTKKSEAIKSGGGVQSSGQSSDNRRKGRSSKTKSDIS